MRFSAPAFVFASTRALASTPGPTPTFAPALVVAAEKYHGPLPRDVKRKSRRTKIPNMDRVKHIDPLALNNGKRVQRVILRPREQPPKPCQTCVESEARQEIKANVPMRAWMMRRRQGKYSMEKFSPLVWECLSFVSQQDIFGVGKEAFYIVDRC